MRALRTLVAILFAASVHAATPYHLELQSSPAAVVPLLSKFGTIEFHVYEGGVRAESMWLDSFSRNGDATITLINPMARMYTDVPVDTFPELIARMTGLRRGNTASDVPKLAAPSAGRVNGIDARRYRLSYSATDWMDIWTTMAVPENPQFRRIVSEFVRHFAPGSAGALARIPGNPIYVELNTVEHPKLPILQLRSLRFDSDGESKALRVGPWYMRAPLLDQIWR